MRNDNYKTKQKELILDTIKKYKHEFTVKDIYIELEKSIGLTTIYRYIDKLYKDGYLNKTIREDNTTYYQYLIKCDNENHFYLKCDKCGSVIHVDCDCISELTNHIVINHKFKPSHDHIIINGTCDKCNKRGNNNE
jgi:Fur family ferric uptake transcriptional regulator